MITLALLTLLLLLLLALLLFRLTKRIIGSKSSLLNCHTVGIVETRSNRNTYLSVYTFTSGQR